MIINSTWFWDDTYIERLNMIVINTINMFQTKLRLLSPLLSSIIIHLSQAEVIIIVRWCSCRLAVTGWVSHVEHELLTHPKHMSSPQILSGVRVARSLVFWVLFGRSLFVLLSLFLWPLYCLSFDLRFLVTLVFVLVAIVLSVLWSTVSGYPFGIFKVFLIEFGHLFKPIWCTWSQSLLNYLAFQSFEYLSVHDEGYCRNVTWELN